MLVKRAAAPKGGGSARSNVRYILGYELGVKTDDREVKNQSFEALMYEAADRPDGGVGTIWSPAIGGGTRPSAVYAANVTNLATADLEMQATSQANKRVKSATSHEIFSFGKDPGMSDSDMIQSVLEVYDHVGLDGAQMVLAVHRDTDSAHVHVARGNVDPRTLRAFDHERINGRLERAARHVEIDRGLTHEKGLSEIRRTADGTFVVFDTTYEQRRAWGRETALDRVLTLERKQYETVAGREGSFERFVDAAVEPRIREAVAAAREAGNDPQAIDVWNVCARYGTNLEIEPDAENPLTPRVYLRDVSTDTFRKAQRAAVAELRNELEIAGATDAEREVALAELSTQQRLDLEEEFSRLLRDGARAEVSDATIKTLRAFEDEISSTRAAEEAFIAYVERNPEMISRALTHSESTFGREDIDRYIAQRVSDGGELDRLTEHVLNNDKEIVMLSPDIDGEIYSTKEMLRIEQRVADLSRTFAARTDALHSQQSREDAIRAMEEERSKEGEVFKLSDEQASPLLDNSRLVVVVGRPGVGKTTMMEVIRRDAEIGYVDENGKQIQRDIVGITLSQAAAERLETEAGFHSVNSARALLAERNGKSVIPQNGIVVLDEAGMLDSKTMLALLEKAQERSATVIAIGDWRQVPPVSAGGAFRILEKAAREHGTYYELNAIRRQKNEWHRDIVHDMTDGIGDLDATKIVRAIDSLDEHGALSMHADRDATIQAAVEWYTAQRQKYDDVLLVATDRQTVRYCNEEIRRQEGREGKGHHFETDDGYRELTKNDRFMFGKNNTKMAVVNGDTGTVISTGRYEVQVQLDRTNEIVRFDPRKYKDWDHGYASTTTRSQGASVSACGGIIDRGTSAELANVALSRSIIEVQAFASRSDFNGAQDIGEHLGGNIAAKGTTQDLAEQLAERGGRQTTVAMNRAARAASAQDPRRKEYEREMAERRAAGDAAMRGCVERFRELRSGALSAEAKAELRSKQRKVEFAISKQYAPSDYTSWLSQRAKEEAIVDERVRAAGERRDDRARELARQDLRERAERTTRGRDQRDQTQKSQVDNLRERLLREEQSQKRERPDGHDVDDGHDRGSR